MNKSKEQIATEAFIYGLPVYEMARMRAATSPRRVEGVGAAGDGPSSTLRWCNTLIHARKLLGAGKSRVVTPNNDTLYTNAWLDLGAGPLRLDVPDTDGRYYVLGFLDFFTNPFAHVGQRLTGTERHSFLIVGPDWTGPVPAEFSADAGSVIRAPTRWVWMIGRILVDGEHDLPAVHALQDQFCLQPFDAVEPEPKRFDAELDPAAPMTGKGFLGVVGTALRENLPPLAEVDWPARFAAIDAATMQAVIEPALMQIRSSDLPGGSNNGWSQPAFIGSSFGDKYLLRAAVALNYIGMLESHEASYPMAWRDANGDALTGQHRYRLHFAAGGLPPVDAFWSLTLYDAATRMLVDNQLGRYAIGDRSPEIQHDAGGGLTLLIQHIPPDDVTQHANWLPAPVGEFYLCLRLYLPRESFFDGSYTLPPLERVD